MTQPIEELAMRFAILVTMPTDQFCGHEEELKVTNEQLWDNFQQPEIGIAIVEAKSILKLVIS